MGENIESQRLVETNETGRDQSSRDLECVKRSEPFVLTKNKEETGKGKKYYTPNLKRNKSEEEGRILPRTEDSPSAAERLAQP